MPSASIWDCADIPFLRLNKEQQEQAIRMLRLNIEHQECTILVNWHLVLSSVIRAF